MKDKIRVNFIILTRGRDRKYLGELKTYRTAPLTLAVLAGVTPPDVEVSITDEAVEAIDYNANVDIVGITLILPFALRGYQIAQKFRERGVKVVLGGPHPSIMPDEAIEYADSVVIGEGDTVWPTLIEDYKKGNLQRFYRNSKPMDLTGLPIPRRDLFKASKYMILNSTYATRGCTYTCEFCSIKKMISDYRTRPIPEVVQEIDSFGGNRFHRKHFILWDDNLVGNRDYAKKFFNELAPLNKTWFGQGTIKIGEDEELTKIASKSGCKGFFIGLESFEDETLIGMNKKSNKVEKYKDSIKRLHDHGIFLITGIMVGFDHDKKDVFEKTLEMLISLNIDDIACYIVTPIPKTPLFNRLESEGRLLHRDWSK
ncbi:MAG: B12-binding domain-containing radical SAM protein, partial [Spirochaetota bacterium]|nr:B12-binding domain-containing radical SAM protein [Spirochaetota bacterium]